MLLLPLFWKQNDCFSANERKNDQELITFSFKYDFLIVRHCFFEKCLENV